MPPDEKPLSVTPDQSYRLRKLADGKLPDLSDSDIEELTMIVQTARTSRNRRADRAALLTYFTIIAAFIALVKDTIIEWLGVGGP
jgi:hypothetical protein